MVAVGAGLAAGVAGGAAVGLTVTRPMMNAISTTRAATPRVTRPAKLVTSMRTRPFSTLSHGPVAHGGTSLGVACEAGRAEGAEAAASRLACTAGHMDITPPGVWAAGAGRAGEGAAAGEVAEVVEGVATGETRGVSAGLVALVWPSRRGWLRASPGPRPRPCRRRPLPIQQTWSMREAGWSALRSAAVWRGTNWAALASRRGWSNGLCRGRATQTGQRFCSCGT